VIRTIPLLEKAAENVPLFVQLGSFGVELNAQNLMKELHDSNESTANVYKLTKAQGILYRVRLGPLYDIGEANSVVARLKSKGFKGSRIVVRE
jgi:cell division septation protein DedD